MSARRILVINIFGIGDVLFSTPLLRNIKEHCPDAFVGYVCNKRARAVLERNSAIDRIHIYEKDDYRALYKKSKISFLKAVIHSLSEIKKDQYDTVIDLSLNFHASFLMFLLGIKTRVGFNYKNRSPFLTKKINILGFEGKHVVEHYLDVLRSIGMPAEARPLEVTIAPEDMAWADKVLLENAIRPGDVLIGIVLGGGASWGPDARYRRWSPKRHAELADKVIGDYGPKLILLGDPSEKGLGREMIKDMRQAVVNLIGKTSLGQYLALLARCRLVIMNDGGPLHMAVAAGTKTVSLIGPVDENVYGPYPIDEHYVVTTPIACRPCYRYFRRADCQHIGCLNDIQVEAVFDRVQQALGNPSK